MAENRPGSELYTWSPDGASHANGKVSSGPSNSENEARGVQVDVSNVSYSVFINGVEKKLLRNISFHLEPGEMCALMGASGAGKSTLLDLLANRKHIGAWGGEILINRKPRSHVFNRDSAYVLQDDVHIATLTVEETIRYAAWTRMPEGTTVAQREHRVKFLLDMMGISHVKDSIVGDPMHKGISGGQLKRLSIAVEIVHLPNLIFLDEPTSGLDSAIALEVMSAVRRLANQNRTCISTIHQPSPEVYALFDKAVLLSNGRLLYCGPADEAATHFTRPALGYKYDPDSNPAEFIIDVCGGLVNPEGADFPRLPEELEELYKQSDYFHKPAERLMETSEPEVVTRRHATTKITQFKMLMHRGWTALIRDKYDIRASVGKNLIVGILIGVVFSGQANVDEPLYDTQNGNPIRTAETQNLCSLLFFTMMYCLMSNLQAIPALCTRDIVYRRDLASFGYSASPYWAASLLSNLPMVVLTHTIYIILVYTTCAFPSNVGYFMFYYWLLLFTNLVSYYFALFLAAATGNAQLAFAVFPVTFLFICMFAGYTIAVDNVPPGWSWAPYISYARWVFEGLMVNEWTRDKYTSGDQVLEDYAFDDFDKDDSFWIVFLNMLAVMGLSYWAMRPAASKLMRFEDMPPMKAPATSSKKKGLEEQLISPEDKYIDSINAAFPQRSTYDVAWYRSNTGEVQVSKGCRLVFRNLVYSVTNKMNPKIKTQLLKGVSGRAHPGEMCALMGASGAGKSTLLDILAGRKTTGEISGDILFNGSERTIAITRASAYVMQDNVHIGVLTVRQTLTYAAHLRMDEKYDIKIKNARVNKIMDMLGLTEHAGTLVGNEYIRGISGGQLKRLSIGVEIINLPDLIYLDEPTTGLDSSIAYEVMAAVRNLANQNRTVICTIHQPSPMTYFLFDKLLLLAEGRVIYFGPARDVVNYFATSPYQFKYVRGTNPADYVISVAGSFTPSSAGKVITGGELATYYSTGELCRVFMENIDTMIAMDKAAVGEQNIENIKPYPTSTIYQLKTLCERVLVKTAKEPKPSVVTFGRHILIALFYGTIFLDLSDDEYTERMSLMFFSLMFMILGHQQAIPALFEDRLLFYRERGAGAYGAVPYFVSAFFLQVPMITINTLVFAAISYNMAGLWDEDGHFGVYWLVMWLTSLTGLFVCQTMAAVSPTGQAAINFFPVSLFMAVAFAGYIVYIPTFPTWLRAWAPYISFMRWSFQALVLNEFSGNSNLEAASYFIDELGFDTYSRDECVPVLLFFIAAFAAIVLGSLKYINFEER